MTQDELAVKVGVGPTTMKEACFFFRWLEKQGPNRKENEDQVFSGMSFSDVMIGALGSAATKGVKRTDREVWSQLDSKLTGLKTQFKAIEPLLSADPNNGKYLRIQIRGWAKTDMPPAVRAIWIEALSSDEEAEEL